MSGTVPAVGGDPSGVEAAVADGGAAAAAAGGESADNKTAADCAPCMDPPDFVFIVCLRSYLALP